MFRFLARAGLLRLLGRRVLPILMLYDGYRLFRSMRGRGDRDRRDRDSRERRDRDSRDR